MTHSSKTDNPLQNQLLFLIPITIIIIVWTTIAYYENNSLIPYPHQVAIEIKNILLTSNNWKQIFITISRGIIGLFLSFTTAIILAVPCGFNRRLMTMTMPIITAIQGCPPIIWISLVIVLIGSGTTLPIYVIFITITPVIFINLAQSIADLDRRLLLMAKLYKVPQKNIIKDLIIPGIYSGILTSLSFALGITWKVTATAEFLGSQSGIGNKLFWSYQNIEMKKLFAWALIIITIGIIIEKFLIHPLRNKQRKNKQS